MQKTITKFKIRYGKQNTTKCKTFSHIKQNLKEYKVINSNLIYE